MEYIKGKCPECKKEIQIPDDLEEMNCIYCGHMMKREDAVAYLKANAVRLENVDADTVKNSLEKLIDYTESINMMFSKKSYNDYFEKLYERFRLTFNEFAALYAVNEAGRAQLVSEVTDRIMEAEAHKLNNVSRMNYSKQLYSDSLYMALFIVPAVGYHKSEGCDALADALVEAWRTAYKKHQITRGNYEEIRDGFRKRRFCYITTAVCQSLLKSDDCYELMALRQFRDGWLEAQPGGHDAVEQYYHTAPLIVQKINQSPDSGKIYEHIFEHYIRPCIEDIEKGQNDACRRRYEQMVDDLDRLTM